MSLGVLATKIGMTQLFMEDGLRVAVTVLQITPNHVVQKKSVQTDGYTAVQVGAGTKAEKGFSKAVLGHYKKLGVAPHRALREFRVDEKTAAGINTGDALGVALLKDAKSVDVSGVTKGRGTAGVIKRHKMAGFPATHGTHEYRRHGGSIGMRATPGKVHPGKRMAGRMGNEVQTVLNLSVIRIDEEKGLICVRGAVPGPKGALIEVRASTHEAIRGRQMKGEAQMASKNPMKASKAGAGAAPAKKK
jgi:large subunit ribosomal protein L3